MGVASAPLLEGAQDLNSLHGPVVSWLRSIDAINTHDASYELAAAGGVTTSLILPGSDNTIGRCHSTSHNHVTLNSFVGGEAYVIKPRRTKERSPTSLLVEPPFGLNTSDIDYDIPPRWRHLKHACGMYILLCVVLLADRPHPQVRTPVGTPEFGARRHLRRSRTVMTYSGTRMDNVWADRQAFVLSADVAVLAHLRYVGTTRRERSKELKTLTAKMPWLEGGRVSVNSRKI